MWRPLLLLTLLVAGALASPWVARASADSTYENLLLEIHWAGEAGDRQDLQDLLGEINRQIGAVLEKEERACWQLLEGTLLVELDRAAEAGAVFALLTRSCPIWEAYNNKAVLEARAGDFTAARTSLDLAIRRADRTEPEEAGFPEANREALLTAVEQPQLVFAGFAAECRTSDPPRADCRSLRPKPEAVEEEESRVEVEEVEVEEVEVKEVEVKEVEGEEVEGEQSIVETSVEEATPESNPEPAPELEEARQLIESWRQAWSEKDLAGYFAAYAPGYKTKSSKSHEQWKKQREVRIEGKTWIEVSIADLALAPLSDSLIRAEFGQRFLSDSWCDVAHKKLLLKRFPEGWKIVGEEAITEEKIPCP